MKKLIWVIIITVIVSLFFPVEILPFKFPEKSSKFEIFCRAFEKALVKFSAPAGIKDLFSVHEAFIRDRHFISLAVKKRGAETTVSYILTAEFLDEQQLKLLAEEFADSSLRCLEIIDKNKKEEKNNQPRLFIPKIF